MVLESVLPEWSDGVNEITFEPASPIGEDGTYVYERGDLRVNIGRVNTDPSRFCISWLDPDQSETG